ncbi:MAG: glutathione S-transferase [Alphaproteobacteria bacterium]|nr:glutathione S-transferase [Alphaproteobacteria bacterium]
MTSPLTLRSFPKSGHSHRVTLFLSLLGLDFTDAPVDLANKEHKSPAYLDINPFGQVPVLIDGAVALPDSNAILVYLASKYDRSGIWYPNDPVIRARIQRWLSVAAGELTQGPGWARLVTVFGTDHDHDRAKVKATEILLLVDDQLARAPYLTGDAITIADLANYAYIAHAPEGEVSLDPYPNIRDWLARIEALDGFVPMPATATGLAA